VGHLVAVDLETSGLDPTYHEIIEVGVVWGMPGHLGREGSVTARNEFTLEFDESKASPKALEVNGWGKREFGSTVDKQWAREFLMELLNDAHVVGKNPIFDLAFLEQFLREPGVEWEKPWHHRTVDVGALCMGRFRLLDPPNTAAVESLTGIRIPENKRHSALDPVPWPPLVPGTDIPDPL
jgi:oligoribonuclease (3'-5' exoribonuclease)